MVNYCLPPYGNFICPSVNNLPWFSLSCFSPQHIFLSVNRFNISATCSWLRFSIFSKTLVISFLGCSFLDPLFSSPSSWDSSSTLTIHFLHPVSGSTDRPRVIKTIWYGHKNRHTDQWNRIESPERNLHTYGQLIYGKRAKNIQGERIVSSINVLGKTGQPHAKEWNHTSLKPYTNRNSNWIKDLM